jgi:hypothetical protein
MMILFGGARLRADRRRRRSVSGAPWTGIAWLGTMIHHAAALLSFSSVVSLAISVIQTPFGTSLVLASRFSLGQGPLFPSTSLRAVAVSAVAAFAQVKQSLAGTATPLSEGHLGGRVLPCVTLSARAALYTGPP